MPDINKVIAQMYRSPSNCKFKDVKGVCDRLFGKPRIRGSHYYYSVPWPGDPRINIQNRRGYIPEYQVQQVLAAIKKLGDRNDG